LSLLTPTNADYGWIINQNVCT